MCGRPSHMVVMDVIRGDSLYGVTLILILILLRQYFISSFRHFTNFSAASQLYTTVILIQWITKESES